MSFAIAAAILAAIVAWFVRLGAKGAAAEAEAKDAQKEASDARAIATFQQRRADLARSAALERERLAALPPADLAADVQRMLNDADPGRAGAPPAPPSA